MVRNGGFLLKQCNDHHVHPIIRDTCDVHVSYHIVERGSFGVCYSLPSGRLFAFFCILDLEMLNWMHMQGRNNVVTILPEEWSVLHIIYPTCICNKILTLSTNCKHTHTHTFSLALFLSDLSRTSHLETRRLLIRNAISQVLWKLTHRMKNIRSRVTRIKDLYPDWQPVFTIHYFSLLYCFAILPDNSHSFP